MRIERDKAQREAKRSKRQDIHPNDGTADTVVERKERAIITEKCIEALYEEALYEKITEVYSETCDGDDEIEHGTLSISKHEHKRHRIDKKRKAELENAISIARTLAGEPECADHGAIRRRTALELEV
jgi:hypothetical protein